MADRICSIPGCERRHIAKTWCSKHLQMAKAHNGDPLWVKPVLICSVDGCERDAKSLKLCRPHYQKQLKYGDPLGRKLTPLERYESYIDRTTTPTGCHPWTSNLSPSGYGKFYANGTHWRAHRFGWTQYIGPIPDDMIVRHFICDNPPCQNIEHMRVGTYKDNTADMYDKGRQRFGSDYNNGTVNGRAKLTDDAVRDIRRRFATGAVTYGALAREFKVSHGTIRFIVNRQTWTHLV